MKAKKALKRLRRVEGLLSIVIDQFAGIAPGVRELLDSAKASVIRAKAGMNSLSAPGTVKKPSFEARQTKRSHFTAKGRNRISPVAKKRRAVAKRTAKRKTGTRVKVTGERDATKSASPTPPRIKPAERSLAPETPPEARNLVD